jgi:hypothetical protein
VVAASAVATLSANRPGWRCLLAGRPQQVIVARLANQHGGGIALQQPQHGRAPRSSPARVRAAGKLAARSARSRFSSRVWSRAARSSSRAIAPSSAASSPWGTSGLSAAWRSRASRQAMRASAASSFLRAGRRRRATSSGLTGTTVNPASTSARRAGRGAPRSPPGLRPHPARAWRCGAAVRRPARLWSTRRVLITLVGPTQGDEVELLGPIDANAQPRPPSRQGRGLRRRGPVLMTSPLGTTPSWASGLRRQPLRRCRL